MPLQLSSSKWFYLLLIGCVCAFSTCTTDEIPGDQYYIRFKADLTNIVFTEQAELIARFSQAGSQYGCSITGRDNGSNITVQLFSDSAISVGKYSVYQQNGGIYDGALISYEDDNGIAFSQDNGNYDATVEITELTTTTIRGTFQGTVKALGTTISILEGEFFVKRIN